MTHNVSRFRTPRRGRVGVTETLSDAAVRSGLRTAQALAAAVFLLSLPSVAFGDSIEVPTTADGQAPDFLSLAVTEELSLSLDEAIENALLHNVSLAVQRYGRSSSVLGIKEAMGLYDLNLSGNASTGSDTRPPSSLLEVADILTSESDRWNFSLQQASPYGGGVSLDFTNSKQTSSNENLQPNPQFSSGLFFGLRQPLLQNFGKAVTERNITVARTNANINRQQFRVQVESVVRQVSDFYWDLVEAKAQLDVSKESLSLAEDLHRMNKIQVEVGTLAPLEMVTSEAGVAAREEDIIRRQQFVGDAEDQLRRLMNLEHGELWDVPLVPTTDPEIEHEPVNLKAAVETAYAKRADVIQKELSNKTVELDAKVARSLAKPQLDLSGNYGFNGVGGTIDTTINGQPVFSETTYSDTLKQLTDGLYEGWSIRLDFSMPLQNRAAKARRAQADLAVEQANLELRDLKDQVLLEVRRAARAVETAAKAIESARISSKLAQKNLEAEQKRYENGLSTSFRVLEIQEDLSGARSREVQAVISYRKALTAFQQLTGELLEKQNVVLLAED